MRKNSYVYLHFILICSFLFSSYSLQALVDLEEMSQDFVLETKQVEIPGYSNAFNASVIRWKGELLMSFRFLLHPSVDTFDSLIGLIWLDEDFKPIGEAQILNADQKYCRSEDARLVMIDNRLWIVYSDNKDKIISRGGFRLYVCELIPNGREFTMKNVECLNDFEGENKQKREKNWTPFDYQGHLLLAYSLIPHKIFRPFLDKSGRCETFSCSKDKVDWGWGEMRGGTSGLLTNGQYLAFFHSSKDMASVHSQGKKTSHYFMGAYTFSNDPPFELTGISPEPIVGKNFYEGAIYKPYWKPVNVVFPGGFVQDEKFVWVSYGRQDREIWVVKMDKTKLLKSLVPISTIRQLNRQ